MCTASEPELHRTEIPKSAYATLKYISWFQGHESCVQGVGSTGDTITVLHLSSLWSPYVCTNGSSNQTKLFFPSCLWKRKVSVFYPLALPQRNGYIQTCNINIKRSNLISQEFLAEELSSLWIRVVELGPKEMLWSNCTEVFISSLSFTAGKCRWRLSSKMLSPTTRMTDSSDVRYLSQQT